MSTELRRRAVSTGSSGKRRSVGRIRTRDDSFMCADCSVNTERIKEYYMAVWLAAHAPLFGMLCIGCLEARLGRQLVLDDFPRAPMPKPDVAASRLSGKGGFAQREMRTEVTHEARRGIRPS
jgi:hypothetical protein